jgi:periplasmic divalent cation tolerance protein
MTDKIVVLVACGSKKEARHIAKSLVERRLAACVQQVGGTLHSTYRWKGKVESGEEFLLLIKTTRRRFSAVSELVSDLHSYEVPEIIALRVEQGSRDYLDWITSSTTNRKAPSFRS